MRILITGGLGYVGMALVDSFRNDFLHEEAGIKAQSLEVTILDKDFIPQRVASLQGTGLNFRFVQEDINSLTSDQEKCKEFLKGFDVIYHLASPVEAELSVNKENETWQTIKNATEKLANCKPLNCVFVFASTANVFGGLSQYDSQENLNEKDTPKPMYPYAKSKLAAENALLERRDPENIIICRFGTAYGYSDGIRFNLVTNIFFKQMLLGQPIEVFGDGSNFRSFCHVRDLARAMRFLVNLYQKKQISDKQVFHVVQANFQIKELAQIIASFNKNCQVVFPPNKPASFMSYHLSSKKLTDLGFKFEENLKESTEEMVKIFGVMKK